MHQNFSPLQSISHRWSLRSPTCVTVSQVATHSLYFFQFPACVRAGELVRSNFWITTSSGLIIKAGITGLIDITRKTCASLIIPIRNITPTIDINHLLVITYKIATIRTFPGSLFAQIDWTVICSNIFTPVLTLLIRNRVVSILTIMWGKQQQRNRLIRP